MIETYNNEYIIENRGGMVFRKKDELSKIIEQYYTYKNITKEDLEIYQLLEQLNISAEEKQNIKFALEHYKFFIIDSLANNKRLYVALGRKIKQIVDKNPE